MCRSWSWNDSAAISASGTKPCTWRHARGAAQHVFSFENAFHRTNNMRRKDARTWCEHRTKEEILFLTLFSGTACAPLISFITFHFYHDLVMNKKICLNHLLRLCEPRWLFGLSASNLGVSIDRENIDVWGRNYKNVMTANRLSRHEPERYRYIDSITCSQRV